MKSIITPYLLLLVILLFLRCTTTVQQGEWKTITFMDCANILHRVTLCVTGAQYDSETGYMKVEGRIKNLLRQERRFNLRNWVFRLSERGRYLKAKSVGLPVVPLQPKRRDGTSREESFTLVFKLKPHGYYSKVTIDYADQFFMTGKINKIVLSVPLQVSSGKVTSRG